MTEQPNGYEPILRTIRVTHEDYTKLNEIRGRLMIIEKRNISIGNVVTSILKNRDLVNIEDLIVK